VGDPVHTFLTLTLFRRSAQASSGHPSGLTNIITPNSWINGSGPAMTSVLDFCFAFGPANAAGQLRDQSGHSLDRTRRCLALFVETILHGCNHSLTEHPHR